MSIDNSTPAFGEDEPGSFHAPHLPGWKHVSSGKVRDIYIETSASHFSDAHRALVVASDRVSAHDRILEPAIPGKGELLTTLSLWWFDRLAGIPNHLVPDHTLRPNETVSGIIPASVAGRAMLVRVLDMYPIECVVRGYLAGSAWAEYQATGSICGITLPNGLSKGDKLPEPLYTPAWKAPAGSHDENITFEKSVELVGETAALELRRLSLEIYNRAHTIAEFRGLILADTKFEFGVDREAGTVTLADEVLTSDSSRYWDASAYAATHPDYVPRVGVEYEQRPALSNLQTSGTGAPPSASPIFDKQPIRDWLSTHWDGTGEPPRLSEQLVDQTAASYRMLLERLTDEPC